METYSLAPYCMLDHLREIQQIQVFIDPMLTIWRGIFFWFLRFKAHLLYSY
jgi:hypothetical protein